MDTVWGIHRTRYWKLIESVGVLIFYHFPILRGGDEIRNEYFRFELTESLIFATNNSGEGC